ncbi:MAG: putative ABC transporter permease [Spirochaetaceae bacterium]|jgi:uncharacterized membrane protein|nr:putative ABC transporter permease [Spirochaetaceae bacterium]
MKHVNIQEIVFALFLFGCTGWALETMQESIVRKKFISKGFFKGPFLLCHGIGGLCVLAVVEPFKEYPVVVFFAGGVLCTIVEFATAIFLETCFNVKCWDYATYPHTKWCHLQGRICLTISLFFGAAALFLVYFYWDAALRIVRFLGGYIWFVDGGLVLLFLADAISSCKKMIKNKIAGIKIAGYAVFSKDTK